MTLLGCDDRAIEISRESANRQAKQNETMAALQHEVTQGSRMLVEEDGAARQQAWQLQQDIQSERAALAAGWDDLEAARREFAASRRSDATWARVLKGGAAILAGLLSLAYAYLTLHGLRSAEAPVDWTEPTVAQLLLEASHSALGDEPILLRSSGKRDDPRSRLSPPPSSDGEPDVPSARLTP